MANFLAEWGKNFMARYTSASGRASALPLHMISGPLVGAVMGWFLDDWLGTSPWLFIVFIVLGIVAGVKNVYVDAKRLHQMQEKEGHEADAGKNAD